MTVERPEGPTALAPHPSPDQVEQLRATPEWLRLRDELLVAQEDAWLEAVLVAKGASAPEWLRDAVDRHRPVRPCEQGEAAE